MTTTEALPASKQADEIRELARIEAELFQAWIDDEPEDGERDAPSVEYWAAFDAWQNAYDRRVMPIAAREMEDLAREYVAWDMSTESEPPKRFWLARQMANEACQKVPPVLPPLQTPAELVAEKVSIRQIAKIWHLLLGDGEPDITRVEAELAKPGSVITADHIARMDNHRLAQLGFCANSAWEEKPMVPETPIESGPTLEQMIADRANVSQIARAMADRYSSSAVVWMDVIPLVAGLMGVTLAQNATSVVNEGGQSVSEKIYGEKFVQRGQDVAPQIDETEITLKSDDDDEPPANEPVDIDAKIVALFEGGQDPVAIAREVDLPLKKVKGVITKRQKSMQGSNADQQAE